MRGSQSNDATVPFLRLKHENIFEMVTVRAKVVRIPGRIFKVMNFMLEDEAQETMQAVMFEEVAQRIYPLLKALKWYVFKNVIVQVNNRNSSKEIKIISQTEVTLYDISRMSEERKGEDFLHLRDFTLKDYLHDSEGFKKCQGVRLTGRVRSCEEMGRSNGRKLKVLDVNGQFTQVILWREANGIQINVLESYCFSPLRLSFFNGQMNLQSKGFSTTVTPISSFTLQPQAQAQFQNMQLADLNEPKKTGMQNPVKSGVKIVSIHRLIEQKRESNCNIFVVGFIGINLHGERLFYDDRKRFFFINCDYCTQREIRSDREVSMGPDGEPFCLGCRGLASLQWNIRALFYEQNSSYAPLKCYLGHDISQQLMGMTPKEGYSKFMEDKEAFLWQLKEWNLTQGVYRMAVKRKSEYEVYYNIMEKVPYGIPRIFEKMKSEDSA